MFIRVPPNTTTLYLRSLPFASLRRTTTTSTRRLTTLSQASPLLERGPRPHTLRTMSTAPQLSTAPAPGKHRFIVYAPDKTDEGTLARRLEVREKHLESARAGYSNGVVRLGGMMTTPEAITNPDAPKKMIGSVLIYEADSLEQVKEIVESDIYYTAGVWDPERIIISPFFSAFPL